LLLINQLPPAYGWRAAFGFGAVVAIAAAIARRYIPESPRWLLAHGDAQAAAAVVDDIEHARFTKTPAVRSRAIVQDGAPRLGFWSQSCDLVRQYPGRLALGCALDFSEAAGYYGLFAFLALFILPAVHVAPAFVPWFYLIGNVGAFVGGVIVAWLLDRAGRKITVPATYVLAAFGVLLMAGATATHDWRWVLAAFTLANLFATGAWISAYPTFSEIFPTHLRSTGIGISVAIGRIGAFIAPLLLTAIADSAGMVPALLVLAVFWLIGAIAMIPWYFRGVEGKGTPLEAMVN
jgi:MFS family permease